MPNRSKDMSARADKGNFISHMIPKPWVVVADGRCARIYTQKQQEFDLIHEIEEPELLIDGLDNVGRGRNSNFGAGHHAYEPSLQESNQIEMTLARSIATWLESMFHHGRFESLVLVAAPRMLGELRKNLDKHVQECVVAESHKQLTGLNENALAMELRRIVPGPDKE